MAYLECPMLGVLDQDHVQDLLVEHAHLYDVLDDQDLVQDDLLGQDLIQEAWRPSRRRKT